MADKIDNSNFDTKAPSKASRGPLLLLAAVGFTVCCIAGSSGTSKPTPPKGAAVEQAGDGPMFVYYAVILAHISGHTGTVVGNPHRFPSENECEGARDQNVRSIGGDKWPRGASVFISATCIPDPRTLWAANKLQLDHSDAFLSPSPGMLHYNNQLRLKYRSSDHRHEEVDG